MKCFGQRGQVSTTNALAVVLMRREGTLEDYFLDRDYDRVREVRRLVQYALFKATTAIGRCRFDRPLARPHRRFAPRLGSDGGPRAPERCSGPDAPAPPHESTALEPARNRIRRRSRCPSVSAGGTHPSCSRTTSPRHPPDVGRL